MGSGRTVMSNFPHTNGKNKQETYYFEKRWLLSGTASQNISYILIVFGSNQCFLHKYSLLIMPVYVYVCMYIRMQVQGCVRRFKI